VLIRFIVPNPTGVNRKTTPYRGGKLGNTAAYTATKEAAYYAAHMAWENAGCPDFTPDTFGYHYERHGFADIDGPLKPILDGACSAIGMNDGRIMRVLLHKSYGHAESRAVCVLGDLPDVLAWWLAEVGHG
jgi:hypothetical protein